MVGELPTEVVIEHAQQSFGVAVWINRAEFEIFAAVVHVGLQSGQFHFGS